MRFYKNIHMNRNIASLKRKREAIKVKKYHDLILDIEDIGLLIRLLEFAEFEISRNFKRFAADDIGLKETYYYYRYGCRRLRKFLQDKRGY